MQLLNFMHLYKIEIKINDLNILKCENLLQSWNKNRVNARLSRFPLSISPGLNNCMQTVQDKS